MAGIKGIVTAVILTAALGRIAYGGHIETWYDLPMTKVVERADSYYGLSGVYAVRDDGVKTYNGFVILAADKSIPYGTLIDTSRGTGIVIDYHETDADVIDIATDWRK